MQNIICYVPHARIRFHNFFSFKAGDTCKNRYANLLEFINHRERRQAAADAGIAESHVETSMVHPCYWVNHHSPHYCIDDSGTIFNISLY